MISVADPKSRYLAHREEIQAAIARVCDSGRYINGPEVASFEEAFAAYIGAAQGVGVGNGTDAIQLALRACGVAAGDEVITASHTAVATVAAIEAASATPVLVDIDPESFTIDPAEAERAISKRTKAIVAVHLYGHPADLTALQALCRAHGLRLIEDCCQAHGAEFHRKRVGSFGDAGCFSFYPTKNLGGLGDGGMIVTSDSAIADQCRLLREYGWKERYISDIPGINSRLDELHAAVLSVHLKYLDSENQHRRRLANLYAESFRSAPLTLPGSKAGCLHAFHLYVVRSARRDELREFLSKEQISTAVHYPVPIHLQPAYRNRVKAFKMKTTESIAGEILSLPMHPGLREEDVVRVTEAVGRWAQQS